MGVSIGPGRLPTSKEPPHKLTSEEQKYIKKYKDYMEVKIKKDEYIEEMQRVNKEDWDKYTKGPESSHKKGLELKVISVPAPECQFSSRVMKPASPQKTNVTISHLGDNENALNTLNEKNKEIFLILREIYNNLDTVLELIIIGWNKLCFH